MKIPVTYILLTIIMFLTLGVVRQNLAEIKNSADRQAKNQTEKDIVIYREHVKNVKDPIFATKRGIAFLNKGETQKACAILNQAAKLDSKYRDASFYLGYAYLKDIQKRKDMSPKAQNDELNLAKAALLQAQRIDPLYPATNKLLAVISESQNNDKEKSLWYARYEATAGKNIGIDLPVTK